MNGLMTKRRRGLRSGFKRRLFELATVRTIAIPGVSSAGFARKTPTAMLLSSLHVESLLKHESLTESGAKTELALGLDTASDDNDDWNRND